jgi:Tfp pilus assembly protein PilO
MMGPDERKREELLKFLNQKVFDPILRALPEDYESQDLKRKLNDVKTRTESEKHLFHEFQTAEEVKKNYLADLDFRIARKIDHELDELKLPSLPKVKDEFLRLCEKLRV